MKTIDGHNIPATIERALLTMLRQGGYAKASDLTEGRGRHTCKVRLPEMFVEELPLLSIKKWIESDKRLLGRGGELGAFAKESLSRYELKLTDWAEGIAKFPKAQIIYRLTPTGRSIAEKL